MISCSNCGTRNRDGSKFCNNCGAQLTTPPGSTCPACGTANPAETVFCIKCGARLVPLSAPADSEQPPSLPPIKGLSLPTKSVSSLSGLPRLPIEEITELPADGDLAAPAASDAESSMEIPDWLKNLRAAAPVQDTGPQETEAAEEPAEEDASVTGPSAPSPSEVPDWLARLGTQSPVEEEPTASPAISPNAPDWIQRLQMEPPEETPSEPAAADEPSWLKQRRAAAPTESDLSAGPLPGAEEGPSAPPVQGPLSGVESGQLPSTMAHADLEQESVEPKSSVQSEAGIPSGAEPKGETGGPRAAGSTKPSEPPIIDKSELPDWLRQAVTAQEAQQPQEQAPDAQVTPAWLQTSEPTAPSPTEQAPQDEETPDWLKRLRSATLEPQSAESQAPSAQTEEVSADKSSPEPDEQTFKPQETQASTEERPAGGEHEPDWLRLAVQREQTPAAQEAAQPDADQPVPAANAALQPPDWQALAAAHLQEPVETSGPLGGLRGVLPLALAVTEPHPPSPVRAKAQSDANLFDTILAEAPLEAQAPAPAKPRRALTFRPIIYLLLLLAVVVPFLMPFDFVGSLLSIANPSDYGFYDAIQALPPNSTVLVAFDYDPSLTGEMDLLANAIVRDLIRRRVKIIAVSTYDTGPQIAERVLGSAVGAGGYAYGSDYVTVYLPGHEAGLAQLATVGLPVDAKDYVQSKPLATWAVASKIKSLKDIPLVIELAGSEDPLRMWLEQVQARTGIRMAAGVSAAVEPRARAYRDANQLVAVMSGLAGAARYEILSNQPGLALTSVNAQTAGVLVLVFIILIGNLVHWTSRARGKAT